jgi:glutathionylspermidine synthase
VLALPLLWSVFEDDNEYLPRAVRSISQLPDGKNPVKKVWLVISGNEGELYLDELDGGDEGGGAGNAANAGGACQAVNKREQMQAIYSQMASLWRAQEALMTILGCLEVGRN